MVFISLIDGCYKLNIYIVNLLIIGYAVKKCFWIKSFKIDFSRQIRVMIAVGLLNETMRKESAETIISLYFSLNYTVKRVSPESKSIVKA